MKYHKVQGYRVIVTFLLIVSSSYWGLLFDSQNINHSYDENNHPLMKPASSSNTNRKCFDAQSSDGKRIAQLLCGDKAANYSGGSLKEEVEDHHDDERPNLAICIQGKTRTFQSVLAQETLRTNVGLAFGAKHTAFYFHLSPKDVRGGWAAAENKKIIHADANETLEAIANVLGLDPYQDIEEKEEQHPLLGGMVGGGHREEVSSTANGTIRVYQLKSHILDDPKCLSNIDGGVEMLIDERDEDEVFEYNMRTYNSSGNCNKQFHQYASGGKATHSYVASSIAQWTTFKECHDFVSRQEEKTGIKFDYVIRARPDMVYTKRIQPYCFYSGKTVFTANDWMFFLPRHALDGMNDAYTGMMNCDPKYVWKNEIVEHHFFRVLSEYLRPLGGELQENNRDPNFDSGYVAGGMMLRPPQQSTSKHFATYCDKLNLVAKGDRKVNFNACTKIVQYNPYNVPEINETIG